MFARRPRFWAWTLISAAVLATPAPSQAQWIFGGGNLFGSPVSGVPFGGWWGGYNNAPYRSTGGFYPYGYSMLPQEIYTTVPAYQPLTYGMYQQGSGNYNGYPGATSFLRSPGIATAGYAARMRDTPLALPGGYGRVSPAGLGTSDAIATRPASMTGPAASAGVAPFACAMAGGGPASAAALNYAAATAPPGAVAYASPAARRDSAYASSGVRFAGGAGPEDELTNTAAVDVNLPTADAEVWVEGQRMNLPGKLRHFVSPPLNPGSRYAYEVRARWEQNGQTYSQSRNIEVRAGNTVRVDFTTP